MKISCIAILAVSAPLVSAANGGLKGASRDLAQSLPRGFTGAAPSSYSNSAGGRQELPSIDELNNIYGTFCQVCDFADLIQIGDILGADTQYCGICDLVDEIPDPNDFGTCFSEISTVQVEDRGSVTMKDLKVGARVLTQSGTYEQVYAFGHKNPTQSAQFLQFQTAESSLEMTGGHLVFLEGKANPVRADSVKVGDVFQGENAQVKKIETVQRDGLYSPLTPSGTVVVDGIVASTYISLQKNANEFVEFQGGVSSYLSFQDAIHMALSPFRMLCMGISSSLGNTYTEDGIPLYAAHGMELAKWADSQNIVVQLVLFLAVGALSGASLFVENTFGASAGPLVLAAGTAAYFMMKKSGVSMKFGASKIKSV